MILTDLVTLGSPGRGPRRRPRAIPPRRWQTPPGRGRSRRRSVIHAGAPHGFQWSRYSESGTKGRQFVIRRAGLSRLQAENVDGPGAGAELGEPVGDRAGGQLLRDPGGLQGRVAPRQARRQHRGVRAARAVGGPVRVALAGISTSRSPSKNRSIVRSRWPPVTTTAARAERVDGAGEGLGGRRRRRRRRASGVGADVCRRARGPRAGSASRRSRAGAAARSAPPGRWARAARRRTRRPSPGRARPASRRGARRARSRPPRSSPRRRASRS